jgi:hypothetical protein
MQSFAESVALADVEPNGDADAYSELDDDAVWLRHALPVAIAVADAVTQHDCEPKLDADTFTGADDISDAVKQPVAILELDIDT